jgi:4-hydroxybenzoate polyprenyltransferase
MALTMFFIQGAIGATNDYFDLALDARSSQSKPLVVGVLSPGAALLIAAVCVIAAALLAATLGPAGFLLAMLGLALGLAYNAYLKRTAVSALPYLIAIPLVPVWVWVTIGAESSSIYWLLPLGALAGLGLHLMNALIDFDADRRGGVPGLVQRLGYRLSLIVAWGSPAAAFGLALLLAPAIASRPLWVATGAIAGLGLLLAGVAIYRVRPGPHTLRLNFGILAIATVLAGAAWLAGTGT